MLKQTKRISTLAFLLLMLIIPPAAYAGDDGPEWIGILDSRPSGLIGTWVISGLSFEANNATQFEQEHGALTVGVCTEVSYYVSGNSNIATKIESTEAHKCATGGGDDDEGLKTYAVIGSFPAGLIGNWVIGNVTYKADANTRFEQEHGLFAVGRCVEVKYTTTNLALEIETASGYKCSGATPGATYSQVYGVLEAFPANLIGAWVVNSVTYTANANTRFEQEHGPFFVGGCIEIKYVTGSTSAVEISTESAYKCNSAGGTGPAEQKLYGFIESIPVDPQNGTWTINGGPFVSNTATELKQEHGLFAAGACVEVEYYDDTNGNHLATQIGTEEPYICNTSTYTNEIYGLITSLPPGLYGSWMIGDASYDANINTQFDQEHGSFANGGCVKVKYYVQNGVNYAREIKTKEATHCSSGGDRPSLPGLSKVYATIDSLPFGSMGTLTGLWMIGGVPYQAGATTQFEQEHGIFEAGVCVEAKYTAEGGTNTLIKVETKEASKCQKNGSGEFKAYGVVEIMPAGTLNGTWQVSGITYQADANTHFEQEHGFFDIGAYVEVKYTTGGNTNTALSIETHVAPNGGLNIVTGILTAHDNTDDWANWEVDGVTYLADPVIEVGSGSQVPLVGQTVILNTYRNNGDGNIYITAISRAQRVFLPLILR